MQSVRNSWRPISPETIALSMSMPIESWKKIHLNTNSCFVFVHKHDKTNLNCFDFIFIQRKTYENFQNFTKNVNKSTQFDTFSKLCLRWMKSCLCDFDHDWTHPLWLLGETSRPLPSSESHDVNEVAHSCRIQTSVYSNAPFKLILICCALKRILLISKGTKNWSNCAQAWRPNQMTRKLNKSIW